MTRKTAIVTGASFGIGAATASLLAQEGYAVVLAARRLERLEMVANDIRAQGGVALAVQTDLGEPNQILKLANRTMEKFGRIDVLFNNAGFGRFKWLEELHPSKDIQAQLNVNLTGPILLTQAVLPHMIAQQNGHIINMGSLASLVATPTYSVYAASKFGIRGFSEALRREVHIHNVFVSVIYAGGVSTEFSSRTGAQRKTGVTTPEALLLSPEQVARAVLNLIRRPRRRLILPRLMVFSVWLNALFPGLLDWIIERRFTRPERGL